MADYFERLNSGLDSPATGAFEITPDDDNDLAIAARVLYVGVAGALTVITTGGDTVTFVDAVGWMPIRTARVLATGTDATDIVGLY